MAESDNTVKKGPFDNLDRDELIKKCKGLLAIAKNAKQSKDDLQQENNRLKELLINHETQKAADKQCLSAMQEIVASLTEYKLTATTKIDELENALIKIRQELHDSQSAVIENESLRRQIKRLTDENEELLSDQQMLENQIQNVTAANTNTVEIEQLTTNLEAIKHELNAKNEQIAKYENDTALEQEKCTKQIKSQTKKLALYKTKILEVAGKLKQLKKGKEILSITVDDYSKAVSKWQLEIVTVSSKLIEKIHKLQREKNQLNVQVAQLQEQNHLQDDELSKLRNLHTAVKGDSNDYQVELCQLKEDNLNKTEQLEILHEKLLQNSKDISEYNEFKEKCDLALLNNEQLKVELNAKLLELDEKNKQLADIQQNIYDRLSINNDFEQKYNEVLQCNEKMDIDIQNKAKQLQEITDKLFIYLDYETKYNESLMSIENLSKLQTDTGKKNDEELTNLSMKLKSTEIELINSQQNNNALSQQIQAILEQLNSANQQITNLECQSKDCTDSAANDRINLEKALNAVTTELNENSSSLSTTKSELDSQMQLVKQKSNEITELLEEMRELNEALKNRGDVISKQKSKITDYEMEIDTKSKRITELELIAKEKCLEITKLNAVSAAAVAVECERINLNNDNMSTSTISKLDETNRMRDIEDCFEEKYNKLRALAIKLKKKVAEQTAHITKLESRNSQNSDEGIQITSKLGAIEVQVKNLQSLQNENDSLQDRIEQLSDEKQKSDQLIANLNGKIIALQSDATAFELRNNDLNCNVLEQNKIKAKLDQAIQEYQMQVNGLKAELNSGNILRKELEIENTKLKDEISMKEKDFTIQNDEVVKLNTELARIKASMKSTNVLNLEMEAYEKSLNEVSQKLDAKLAEISDLNTIIKSHESTIESVKNQIKVLEESLDSEKVHSIELKQQVDIQQIKLKENDHDKTELKIKYDSLTKEHQQIKFEIETMRLDAEQCSMDREKIVHALQMENEKNARTICSLTDDLLAAKDKLDITEQELIDIKTEFVNYKVRAQSVLRQNQTKDISRENELEDELATANSVNESLNNKLMLSIEKISQIENVCNDLQKEKDRLDAQCTRYSLALTNLETESRLYTNALIGDKQNLEQDKKKLSMQLRLQNDMLNEYKKKIVELEECQMKQQEENVASRQTIGQSTTAAGSNQNQSSIVPEIGPLRMPATDEQKVEFLLMERQEGEGSDSTSSGPVQRKISTTRNRRDLIPLDELLNTSFDDNMNNDMDVSLSPTIELQRTKDKLFANESRAKHLTILLAEAEQDLAKLTQLNDVLKEELRRNERSTEREQHLHNLEYLKNVVFKFLTINNGDEKCHLVPVLNTILKLSPDEVNKLQSFAKGESNSKGWTNYLPTWKNNA